jgi:hypothetical protein
LARRFCSEAMWLAFFCAAVRSGAGAPEVDAAGDAVVVTDAAAFLGRLVGPGPGRGAVKAAVDPRRSEEGPAVEVLRREVAGVG